jgi:hypothetical protein
MIMSGGRSTMMEILEKQANRMSISCTNGSKYWTRMGIQQNTGRIGKRG